MLNNSLKTIIDLDQSKFAHGFKKEDMIHQEEFEMAVSLIDKQLKSVREKNPDRDTNVSYLYNTISVFGERGTGKSSFLYSIINHVRENNTDVAILDVIDPTLIEEKEHIFLLVVSLINKAVEDKLNATECNHGTQSYHQRQVWKTKLQKIAKGLPTLEKIGGDHKTQQWQSHEFIMERGLGNVLSAFSLARDFHALVNEALDILGKKAFFLALDDIDVDMHKGWDVLEMLRKYVNTPQIITILSGNFKLYSLNVRKQQWKQLEDNRKFEPLDNYKQIVNELEGQYMLKVLKPENRLHLHSVLELINVFKHEYSIVSFGDNPINIKDAYKKILAGIGVKNPTRVNVFSNYLLSLSIRTQIQFLASNKSTGKGQGIDSVEAFLTRLHAAEVDVALAVNNPQMLPLEIQKFIEKHIFTPDLYLLIPNTTNGDDNACLTAFSILFAREAKTYPFLALDYMIRMGYMRNVRLELDSNLADKFFDNIGLTQLMSLKNNVGLSIAYNYGDNVRHRSHVVLPGFSDKNKKGSTESKGRIDYEIEIKANNAQAIIAYLPLCVLRYTEKNGTRVLYSFYNLLAVITELLKIPSGESMHEMMKTTLKNLQVLRSYPTRGRDGEIDHSYGSDVETDENYRNEEDTEDKSDDDSLDELVNLLITWADEFHESLPPYLLGKIATRTYYAIQKIEENNLGEQMHRSVIAFLNASLVEEMTEYYVKSEGKESLDKMNLSNAITKDDVLINNLKFVQRNNSVDSIKFTCWMAKCPLIWSFMHKDALLGLVYVEEDKKNVDIFDFGYTDNLSVYLLLEDVLIKDAKEADGPVFSGGKDKIIDTINYLVSVKYDVKRILNPHKAIPEIIEDIHNLGIFSKKPQKNQISAFRENYKKLGLGDAEKTQKHEEPIDLNSEWKAATESIEE